MSAKSIKVAVLVMLALSVIAPASAYAATTPTRTVTTVTAGQVASRLAGQVRGVELGSTGATVTLEVNGKASPLRVEFGEMAKSVENGGGGGLLALAAIPMVGGALIKILNFLSKLGRR